MILPLTMFLIFLLLFALYSNFKFPFITVGACCCRRRWAASGALADRHAVFGLVRRRLSGPVRRLGADRRRLYFLCQ